jgi:hypothetical protein
LLYQNRDKFTKFFFTQFKMLNVSIFADMADIYVIIHFVPHACEPITVDHSHSSGDTVAKTSEFSNYTRGL